MEYARRKSPSTVVLVAALVLLLLVSSTLIALAQSGGGYDLSWWTVDGGGGTVSESGYTLTGTAGQPDAGAALSGGSYTLYGGFWPGAGSGAAPGGHKLYLPLVMRH